MFYFYWLNQLLFSVHFSFDLKKPKHVCPSASFVLAQIDYFNNQIIVDLVEQQHKGIFSVLDEACMNVGKVTDELFLQGLNGKLAKHAHYTSRKVGNATHNSGKKNPMKPLTWGLTVLTSLYWQCSSWKYSTSPWIWNLVSLNVSPVVLFA